MSTSSSEEGAGMANHSATSSGLESSTGSLLFSVPSDYSPDIQTDVTPSTSPTLSEGRMRTPRDVLDASRRLGQMSVSTLEVDLTPTKPLKHFCHRASSEAVADDEAGYDADGDGDGDGDGVGDGDKGVPTSADATATMRPIRRPGFLRIDTRQHRRVASMLTIQRPSPGFEDMNTYTVTDISYPRRVKLAPLPSIRLKSATTTAGIGGSGGDGESYELRRRVRQRAEPVGLGIGFPENHPLRSRAFTMPVPRTSVSPVDEPGLSMPGPKGMEMDKDNGEDKERRTEWLPPRAQWLKKAMQIDVLSPVPVRKLALRPTFLDVSPSPIDYLPCTVAGAGTTFHCGVDVDNRSEVPERGHGHRHTTGMSVCNGERDKSVRVGDGDFCSQVTV